MEGNSMKLTHVFLTGIAALFLVTGTAHAAEGLDLYTCDGILGRDKWGALRIEACAVPAHKESYGINFSELKYRDKRWLRDVCSVGKHCRVEVIARESYAGVNDTFDALSLLHVTTKNLFSWERCDVHGCD
jgi:hypothetical protein